jgi:hypothetical protein
MCHPASYQVSVFYNGSYVGTVSPLLMDSRADGASGDVRLFRRSASHPIELSVEFARYTSQDPLCCPSAVSTVNYELDVAGEHPLLAPARTRTAASGGASGPPGEQLVGRT